MITPIITLKNITLAFGQTPLFMGAELSIHTNDRICLVGRNGAGKSTLLKVIADLSQSDGGERFVQPGTKISYLPQEPDFTGYDTVNSYVKEGLADEGQDSSYKADIYMEALGISGNLDPSAISGGEARRAALARVIAPEPDILLLDEPTNHLDMTTIEWLEQELGRYRGAIVLISHDRQFLNNLTRTTLWLDRGIVRRMDHGFEHFDAWADEIVKQEETESKKLDKLITKETTWSRQGISARRKRNQGRLRKLRDLRIKRSGQVSSPGEAKISATSSGTPGKLVADIENATKSYDNKVIFKSFSTRILRGDKIGVIGPNGAGKTTLVKVLLGEIPLDKGTIKLGTNIKPVFLDQTRSQLIPTKSVWETLCDQGGDQVFVGGVGRHVISYLKDFLFTPNQVNSPVSSLSGGEKNRLLLAKALATPSNLLVLDEPTNDLDIDTLDILQEVLSEYDGTLLLVSHDRDFLDRIVTSTIVLEGDGDAQEYPGGYSDYISQKKSNNQTTNNNERAQKGRSTTPKNKKRKLSYNDEKSLKELPDKIEVIDQDISKFTLEMEDTDRFTENPKELNKLAQKISLLIDNKNLLEEKWLSLELKKEKLSKV
jgi:ATP-binding cassette subfamily F protein uup